MYNCGIKAYFMGKIDDLLDSYVRDDLKYRQIALNENVSIQTVQRWLDKNEFKKIIATI